MAIVKFDDKGLIPAIIQDADSGEVLMLGYMPNLGNRAGVVLQPQSTGVMA